MLGVYDQDVSEDLLRENPFLYSRGRLGKIYRSYSFWLTMADALYQSVAIFFVCQAAYADSDVDIWEFGTVQTTVCMFAMLLHVAIEIRSWVRRVIQVKTQNYFPFLFSDNNSCCFNFCFYWSILRVFVDLQFSLC